MGIRALLIKIVSDKFISPAVKQFRLMKMHTISCVMISILFSSSLRICASLPVDQNDWNDIEGATVMRKNALSNRDTRAFSVSEPNHVFELFRLTHKKLDHVAELFKATHKHNSTLKKLDHVAELFKATHKNNSTLKKVDHVAELFKAATHKKVDHVAELFKATHKHNSTLKKVDHVAELFGATHRKGSSSRLQDVHLAVYAQSR